MKSRKKGAEVDGDDLVLVKKRIPYADSAGRGTGGGGPQRLTAFPSPTHVKGPAVSNSAS